MTFATPGSSHEHSLQTLNWFYEHDSFMESVATVIDMGCGPGLDLEWWATRTTRDDNPQPLNIKCIGVDTMLELPMAYQYPNIQYQKQDFEIPIVTHRRKYDIAWCHDAFQYVINPFTTLKNWREVIADEGMLVLILPQTTNLEFNTQAFDQLDYCYHNWTMVSLMHILAISGFDCANGFFLKNPTDQWLHAAVYKSDHEPMDPRTTSWYDLCDKNLLPESAVKSINQYGYLRQRDLVLPWLDKSLMTFHKH